MRGYQTPLSLVAGGTGPPSLHGCQVPARLSCDSLLPPRASGGAPRPALGVDEPARVCSPPLGAGLLQSPSLGPSPGPVRSRNTSCGQPGTPRAGACSPLPSILAPPLPACSHHHGNHQALCMWKASPHPQDPVLWTGHLPSWSWRHSWAVGLPHRPPSLGTGYPQPCVMTEGEEKGAVPSLRVRSEGPEPQPGSSRHHPLTCKLISLLSLAKPSQGSFIPAA